MLPKVPPTYKKLPVGTKEWTRNWPDPPASGIQNAALPVVFSMAAMQERFSPPMSAFVPNAICSAFDSPARESMWLLCHFLEGQLSKNRTQQMVDRLRELQASSPDIEASAIVSVDGLSIASALPQGVEEDRVSAMSAAMLSLGERIASELGRGSLEQVYIKGEKGYVVLMSVGQEAVLTALAREQAKLGLIFLDMRRATVDLAKLI